MTITTEMLTRGIFYCRESAEINGCGSLQNCIGLISLKPAIAYFAYTKRYHQFNKNLEWTLQLQIKC
jgi:hypothetical protein